MDQFNQFKAKAIAPSLVIPCAGDGECFQSVCGAAAPFVRKAGSWIPNAGLPNGIFSREKAPLHEARDTQPAEPLQEDALALIPL